MMILALATVMPPTHALAAGEDHVTLVRKAVPDPTSGRPAFTLLVPEEWQRSGGLEWDLSNANLVRVNVRFDAPDGSAGVQLLPSLPFVWMNGGIPGFGPGANYLGREVQPPTIDPAAFVRSVVVPRFRSHAGDVRVLDVQALPKVARALEQQGQAGVRSDVRAGRVRLAYRLDGRTVHEDVYCVLRAMQSPMTGGRLVLWGNEQLYAFRARPGELDRTAPLMQSMIASLEIDLRWFAGYLQVSRLWQQGKMQQIRNAGRLSAYIARVGEEISGMVRDAHAQRQRSMDRVHRRFSQTVRGVEPYRDPTGNRIELPHGYDGAWVADDGTYLLSSEPGFNPNRGDPRRDWERLEALDR